MVEMILDPQTWVAFLTLTALELVLGIDNIVFISILVDRLPKRKREFARVVGLSLAMLMRIALLFFVSWVVGLTEPLFRVFRQEMSGRDLILIAGGIFLLWKSTKEIHHMLEGETGKAAVRMRATFAGIILQIILIDAVFSLDSIITAVGMIDELEVIIAAVIVSVALMIAFARPIGNFVSMHPTVKALALSFLVVIGVVLIADGFDHHVPKGYVYFSLAFAVGVEMINIRIRKRSGRSVGRHARATRADQ
ncbi:MAG: TerC family protein [Candidatus Methylomirabilales bacterium]